MTTASIPAELPAPLTTPSPKSPSQRLLSLDALRGFDLFWILGAEAIVHDLARLFPARAIHIASQQLNHKAWEGFAAYDLIFPLFVFIAGVSLVFSLTKQLDTKGRSAAVRRVITRGVLLYLLGILYYGGLSKHYQDIRLLGVLQRIAISYLVAGLLFCFLRPRALIGVTAGLLVAYWLLLTFVPAPGVSPVSFAEGKNIVNWFDSKFLPGFKWDGDHDPEGILSTFPAIASCLLGVFAGMLLKKGSIGPYWKVLYLLVSGAALVGLGTLWGMHFPIIKKLWTSSFVLVAAGYSAALLGLFYLILDVWNFRFWAYPFVWIGTNAITLYLLESIVNFRSLAERFLGGDFSTQVLQQYGPLSISTLAILFLLLLARFLHIRQIFLRV